VNLFEDAERGGGAREGGDEGPRMELASYARRREGEGEPNDNTYLTTPGK
jgi:hypothetical protein